jgi:O-antigen/teichoic acid export membrane protein
MMPDSGPNAPAMGDIVDPIFISPTPPNASAEDSVTGESPGYAALSYRQLLKRLATSVSVYSVGVFATRFGALLLVPIYWRVLTPGDYGILAVATIVTSVIAPLLGLAISESIIRFYKIWPAAERRDRLGSAWTLDWVTSILFGGTIALLAGPLLKLTFPSVPVDPFLRLAIVVGTLNSFSASPLVVLRVEERDKEYVRLSVTSFLLQTVIILILVVHERLGALGVLGGQALAGILMLPIYARLMHQRARLGIRLDYAREALSYSLPLVPGGLIESFTPMTDRFVLEKYVNLSTLGIYGLADTFASIVRTVSVAIKSAWVPFQIRLAAERDDAEKMMARSADQIALAIFTVGLSLAVLGRDLVSLIGNPAYFSVGKYMVPLVLSYIFNGLQPVFATGFLVARKTKYAWTIALTHLVVALSTAFLLIPSYGVLGAIMASVLGYGSRLGVGFYLSQTAYPIPFHWRKLSILGIGTLAGYFISTILPAPPSYLGGALRLVLVLAFFPAMFTYLAGRDALLALVPQSSRTRKFPR